MAKETFIIRTEWFNAISELEPLDQAELLKYFFYFHSDMDNLIKPNNLNLKLVWKLIEPNLIRNITTYNDKRSLTSSENGKLGGRPRKQSETEESYKPNNLPNNLTSLFVPVSDIVNDKENKPVLFSFKSELLKLGLNPDLVNDFMKVRKYKKATDTETAFNKFISEVKKSGKPISEIVTICVEKDWKGFEATWLNNLIPNKEIKTDTILGTIPQDL